MSRRELNCSIETALPTRSELSRLPSDIAWHPDGERLAYVHDELTIRVMHAATGQVIRDFASRQGNVRALAWSPDGSRLAAGGERGQLTLWSVTEGQAARAIPSASTSALCWDPEGRYIATASPDTNVYIWDAETGLHVRSLSGHTTFVHTVSWSADGKRIASADEAGSIRIWDARSGQQTLTLIHPSGVPQIAWHPDSRRLACVGYGGGAAVRVFDANVPKSLVPYW
jgi:WD40 repeat protein